MRPFLWHPPVELSLAEQRIVKRIRRAKLFVFLRLHRSEIFSDAFQEELGAAFADRPRGQPPVPPAQLDLAMILQACLLQAGLHGHLGRRAHRGDDHGSALPTGSRLSGL